MVGSLSGAGTDATAWGAPGLERRTGRGMPRFAAGWRVRVRRWAEGCREMGQWGGRAAQNGPGSALPPRAVELAVTSASTRHPPLILAPIRRQSGASSDHLV